MAENPQVTLSGFADEAANQKTAVQQFAAFAALGLQYLQPAVHRRRRRHQERDEAQQGRDPEDPPPGGRVWAERGVDRLADRQGQAARRRRRHEERLRAVQEIPGKGRQESLRAGPCLRDQADPRLLVLSPQGNRPSRAPAAGRRSAGPDRRGLPAQRPDLRRGGRGQPGRPERRDPGRDPPPGEQPGAGADLRRRQSDLPGIHAPPRCSSNFGDEAGPGLDAHQGLPPSRAARPANPRRRGDAQALRAGRHGRQRPRSDLQGAARVAAEARRRSCAAAAFRACFSTSSRT